jgi:hypothetical protein
MTVLDRVSTVRISQRASQVDVRAGMAAFGALLLTLYALVIGLPGWLASKTIAVLRWHVAAIMEGWDSGGGAHRAPGRRE